MHYYRIRTIKLLFGLMGVFTLIFLIALYDQSKNTQILNLNLNFENYLVMIFCILAMLRVVYELYKVEKKQEYERRITSMNYQQHL